MSDVVSQILIGVAGWAIGACIATYIILRKTTRINEVLDKCAFKVEGLAMDVERLEKKVDELRNTIKKIDSDASDAWSKIEMVHNALQTVAETLPNAMKYMELAKYVCKTCVQVMKKMNEKTNEQKV